VNAVSKKYSYNKASRYTKRLHQAASNSLRPAGTHGEQQALACDQPMEFFCCCVIITIIFWLYQNNCGKYT